jgi:hypothetical protein
MIVPKPDSPPPFYRYNRAERQVYLSAYHLSPKSVASYVEGLNRYHPQVLTGLAHSHYLLARLMSEAGLRLDYRPLAAVLGSEKVWPHMRTVISEVLRTPVFEEYGSVENCVLATECAAGNLHVSPDFGLLEVLNADGGRGAPRGAGGRGGARGGAPPPPPGGLGVGGGGVWAHRRPGPPRRGGPPPPPPPPRPPAPPPRGGAAARPGVSGEAGLHRSRERRPATGALRDRRRRDVGGRTVPLR